MYECIINIFTGSYVTYKVTTKTSDILYAGSAGVDITFLGRSKSSDWEDLPGDFDRGDKRTHSVSGVHYYYYF